MKPRSLTIGLFAAVMALGGCVSPSDIDFGELDPYGGSGPTRSGPILNSTRVEGVVSEGGTPIPGVAITLNGSTRTEGTSTSNTNGEFDVTSFGTVAAACTGLTIEFLHPDGRSAFRSVPDGCGKKTINYNFS